MMTFWRILKLLRTIKLLLTMGGLLKLFTEIVPDLIRLGSILDELEIELRKRCEKSKRSGEVTHGD